MKSYNNEQYFFYNIVQASCSQKNNVLMCTITRDAIENNLPFTNKIYLVYFDREGELQLLRFSSYIDVTYKNEKTDIFVWITNLLSKNDIGAEGPIIFETNVTEISNVDTWIALDLFCKWR